MLDPIALIEAQRLTHDLARGARPDSPALPEPPPDQRSPVDRWAPFRLRLSQELRRVADLVDPGPICGAAAVGRR